MSAGSAAPFGQGDLDQGDAPGLAIAFSNAAAKRALEADGMNLIQIGHALGQMAARWFAMTNLILMSSVPILAAVSVWVALSALRRESSHRTPCVMALILLFLGYSGLAISLWPCWSAAS